MASNTVATSQSSSVTFKIIRYSLKVSFLALLPHFKRPPDCGLWLLMCWTARNTGQSPSWQRSLRGSADLGSVDGTGKRSAWWRCSHQALKMLLRRPEASVIWKRQCLLLLLPPFLPPPKTNPNPSLSVWSRGTQSVLFLPGGSPISIRILSVVTNTLDVPQSLFPHRRFQIS